MMIGHGLHGVDQDRDHRWSEPGNNLPDMLGDPLQYAGSSEGNGSPFHDRVCVRKWPGSSRPLVHGCQAMSSGKTAHSVRNLVTNPDLCHRYL